MSYIRHRHTDTLSTVTHCVVGVCEYEGPVTLRFLSVCLSSRLEPHNTPVVPLGGSSDTHREENKRQLSFKLTCERDEFVVCISLFFQLL